MTKKQGAVAKCGWCTGYGMKRLSFLPYIMYLAVILQQPSSNLFFCLPCHLSYHHIFSIVTWQIKGKLVKRHRRCHIVHICRYRLEKKKFLCIQYSLFNQKPIFWIEICKILADFSSRLNKIILLDTGKRNTNHWISPLKFSILFLFPYRKPLKQILSDK